MRGTVGLLVACDLRRRWRALLAVTVLLGLAGAVVMTAVGGARRSQSAYPRLTEALATADASVEVGPEYFEEIEALPQVEAAAPASFVFVFVPGLEDEDVLSLAAVDDRFNRAVDRPLELEGRHAELDRPDEVMVDSKTAERLGLEVGDQLRLTSLAPDQLEPLIMGEDPGEPAGPDIDVTLVGIGRTQMDLADGTPLLLFTPAFYQRYQDEVAHFDDILSVRLRNGAADMPAFEQAVAGVVPASEGAIIETQDETATEIQDATRVQAVSLVIFAGAFALAALVAVGQALARQTAGAGVDQPILESLGVSRRQRFQALVAPGVLVAVAGSFLAVVLAVVASPTMPIGFARQVEPDPGFEVDGLLLTIGFATMAALVIARVSVSAWSTSGRSQAGGARGSSWAVSQLAGIGAPPPLQTGVRLALETGHGRTAVPVRPALVGAVIGVAGLVAALTFGAALRWTVSEPIAFGLAWDTNVLGPRDAAALDRQVAELADHDGVEDVAALQVLPIRLDGIPIQAYGLEAAKGGGFLTVLDGRAPQGSTEVLVGSATLDRHGLDVGDTVRAEPLEGGAPVELTIVGRGVFPEFVHPSVPDSDTGRYNDLALLTGPGLDAMSGDRSGEFFSMALVRWEPGADATAESARLEEEGTALLVTVPPAGFANLERVDAFPWVVAGFLVLVAAVATGHALAMSVRRRGVDFAVLRTLGFDRGQVRAALAWQATTLAMVGLVAGIPLGLVIGRVAWTLVAQALGIAVHIPIPWLALAMIVPLVLVVTNLLAVLPARRAARTRPAAALRTE